MKISDKIQKIKNDYKKNSTMIVDGLKRNQWDIIKRVYYYKNDKFMECTDDEALFWQVVTPYLPHYSKLIDIDFKDIKPQGLGETNQYQAWVLRQKLHSWFKQKDCISGDNFGVFIDDITKNVASFGSYVVKINKKTNEPEFVDLRHIFFDPHVKTIRGEDKVEEHLMTEDQIRDKEAWDNVEELIKNAEEENDKKIIWEYFGKNDDNELVHIIGAGSGKKETIAFEEEINEKNDPYWDIHLGPYEGMWLRKGVYEICFPEQWRANELVNQNREATQIASLLLLRSNDSETDGINVLHKALSGQIIKSEDLQQIPIDNRAFQTLLGELDTIQNQVRKKLQLPDIATGESLPSGTPFRGMALMSSSQKDAFKQTRARISSGIVNIVENIIPKLVKDWNTGDIVEISQDSIDIEMYDEAIKKVVYKNIYKKANENGILIKPEEEQTIDEKINKMIEDKLKKNGRKLKIPKNFFNFEYGFRIDPVGETYDKAAKNDAIINAITLVLQNPNVTEIPLFSQLLENNGITPFKLKTEVKKKIQTTQQEQPQIRTSQLQGLTQQQNG